MSPGICPYCDATGPIGAPCRTRGCVARKVCMLPPEYAGKVQRTSPGELEPLVGTFVGDYLILDRLGRGGFGRVLLGLQRPLFEPRGAIKLLDPDNARPEVRGIFLEKFENEARTLAVLRHPNIVSLLQYGVADGRPYLVMEYIPGSRTLASEIGQRVLRGEGLDIAVIRRVVEQILRALEAAHKKGVVHRDLKPENVMLEEVDGDPWVVKLVDFGLAKVMNDQQQTGIVLGTLPYMAPEQLSVSEIGPWTDLYALGVIVFELMTGRRLFTGSNAEILAIKRDPRFDPTAGIADLELPPPLVAFFQKALAFSPSRRFQSTSELRTAIGAIFDASAETFVFQRDLRGLVDSSEIAKLRAEVARAQAEKAQLAAQLQAITFGRRDSRERVEAPRTEALSEAEVRALAGASLPADPDATARPDTGRTPRVPAGRRASKPVEPEPTVWAPINVATGPRGRASEEVAAPRRAWVLPLALVAIAAVAGVLIVLLAGPGATPSPTAAAPAPESTRGPPPAAVAAAPTPETPAPATSAPAASTLATPAPSASPTVAAPPPAAKKVFILTTEPPGATVAHAGALIGETPIQLEWVPGRVLDVVAPGHEPARYTIASDDVGLTRQLTLTRAKARPIATAPAPRKPAATRPAATRPAATAPATTPTVVAPPPADPPATPPVDRPKLKDF
ncbi:MAG: serine/threonine protein kinase [Deltaproteobacteria bacterium]|nr:serine/threonine protein kinase [Deltaproteobacteria bacterium]